MDRKVIVKITDFGTICEVPINISADEKARIAQSLKEWFSRGDKSQWFVTDCPVEIIDCRTPNKPDTTANNLPLDGSVFLRA